MKSFPLKKYCNRYRASSVYIIGRGPTQYDYHQLAFLESPVLFLNDAVALEQYLNPNQNSFFFALDKTMAVWLPRISSIAVLPLNHKGRSGNDKIITGRNDSVIQTANKIILWEADGVSKNKLLESSREEVASLNQLYIGKGTIHSAIHFAWYIGGSRICFVGCDGINKWRKTMKLGANRIGYDKRIPNLSKTRPWWQYDNIREEQDWLCQYLKLDTLYLGTPHL